MTGITFSRQLSSRVVLSTKRILAEFRSGNFRRESRSPFISHKFKRLLPLFLSMRFPFLSLPSPLSPTMASASNSLMWFRKGLRIHDNPALEHAARGSDFLYPVFVIDPHYMEPDPETHSPGSTRAGLNRIRFLLESLVDLDSSLKKLGSRLLVLKGEPCEVLIRCLKEWNIRKLCFEFDTEPYYQAMDDKIKKYCAAASIETFSPVSHTLFDPAVIIQKNGGKPPLSYQSFIKLAGEPSWTSSPISPEITCLPSFGDVGRCSISDVPSIEELGYVDTTQDEWTPFKGGESEALRRLRESISNKEWVAKFEKPKGDPSSFLRPATTVLSPYLKFGCLSSRYFYQCIQEIQRNVKRHTSPPVSLVGQLLWRDFFYTAAFGTPNFDQMKDNRICKQVPKLSSLQYVKWMALLENAQYLIIALCSFGALAACTLITCMKYKSMEISGLEEVQIPWKNDDELLAAWRDARTGFPWIDAIMVQLRKWGWMHHLARHCVACFLTRGDLFVHWEKGRDVFGRLLIDSDWSINNANWLWLSCSSFFYQYNRIYSPISFGKKYDPNGNYIRHFLPVLKDMPKEYIYEPWTAPRTIQVKANCIVGKDYPMPVIDHNLASKECKQMLSEAYELNKRLTENVSAEELKNMRRKMDEDKRKEQTSKKLKQTKLIG